MREDNYRLGREADDPEAQVVFIDCTTFGTLEILEPWEEDLGKPVVTANQATTWESLQLAGVNPKLEEGKTMLSMTTMGGGLHG